MRSLLTKTLVATFIVMICATVVVAKKKKDKTYTLPNGKVLINPYVITENPDSLEVGHNNGIIKVMLKDLPVKLQKKYHYSPEKAKAYEKKQAKLKKQRKKNAAKEARNKKIKDEQFRRYRRDASIETLQIDIKKCENRITFLKKEIPRLESSKKNLLNKTTNMATSSVSSNSGSRGGYNTWGGGYYSTGNGSSGRAERTKDRQIRKLDDEYATTKQRLRTYQKELATKEIDLIKLNTRLTKAKKHKAEDAPLPKIKK